MRSRIPGTFICLLATLCIVPAARAQQAVAEQILRISGVKGGLVVHVGCGDGRLTAALRANDSYMVQGLDTSAQNVARAREHVRSLGLYGDVSVSQYDGKHLPYIDNLVNLVVAQQADEVSRKEIVRVLAPNGVACIERGDNWAKIVKQRPEQMDEWTHYMHDSTGNAVSNDTLVGPPANLQWVGSPRWTRHHEHMSSLNALVSANGRLFYIVDEGSRASIQLPPRWYLVARDAFNGTILWKRPIPLWYTHLYPLKSGPAFLPRRLVAEGDRVYVTLGLDEPLVALDAATGETILTYGRSKATEEVIACNGILLLLVNSAPLEPDLYTWNDPVCWNEKARVQKERPWDQKQRTILAVDAETGDRLWTHKSAAVPLSLATDGNRVVFHDGDSIVCLDHKSGKPNWSSEPIRMRKPLPTCFAPTLVMHEDVVLFAGGDRKMTAVSAETGRSLWTQPHHRAGHNSPEDVLVIDGLAWTGKIAGGRDSGVWTGYDVTTGRVAREFTPDVETYWFHHRCYRSKATVNYLLPSRTGLEFVDWRKETWEPHHWVRGACVYGIMPCNGLVYAPPHACSCYLETKLNGFNALAPASKHKTPKPTESARLKRGPAYSTIEIRNSKFENPSDWPVYRHDAARSGYARTTIGANLKSAWETDLGGRLSAVTVADGRCFVASIDTHTVFALDTTNGRELWRFTADGRVDSPPTIYNGCAYFGSADGYVYCLRASDGALAWRYLAAPADRRMMSFEQFESCWPVHGSVLIRDGQLYCVAGRSAFLDGGMRLCRLDAKTGKLISETMIDDREPGTERNLQATVERLDMPAALPDVLSCDGRYIYMRSQRFDLEGNRENVVAPVDPMEQGGETAHLFCSIGFLDGSWFHRAYWQYGRTITSGCNYWFRAAHYAPSARIMVFDETNVYGYGRKPMYYVWSPALEYRLFAAEKEISPEAIARVARAEEKIRKGDSRWFFNRDVTMPLSVKELSTAAVKWNRDEPQLMARAMVLADKTLFVAGPRDVLDEEAAVARRFDDDVQKQLTAQDAALAGAAGALLWTVSAESGERIAELELDSTPVWDGMVAARGRLFLATTDGKMRCFRGI
jgi:outer membrane protein assembly factor BamB